MQRKTGTQSMATMVLTLAVSPIIALGENGVIAQSSAEFTEAISRPFTLAISQNQGSENEAMSRSFTIAISQSKGTENEATSRSFTVMVGICPADFNRDGYVDQGDFALFEACVSGPTVPYTGDCSDADFDTDSDVDQSDFGIFQRCYSGENEFADPNCAN